MPIAFANSLAKLLRGAADKIGGERVRDDKLTRWNPLRDLTPEKVVARLEAFERGELKEGAMLFDAILRREDVLQSVVDKRLGAVASLDWEVCIDQGAKSSRAAQRQKDALEYLYNHITATSVLDPYDRGGLARLITQMMLAHAHKWSVHELAWEQDNNGLTLTAKNVPLWYFECKEGPLRLLPTNTSWDGVPLEPSEAWMVTRGKGMMEACAVLYLAKNMGWKDWLAFSEIFGVPPIFATTTAQPETPEWQQQLDALADFGHNWRGLFSQGTELKTLDQKASGDGPQKSIIDRADMGYAVLWRGGDLGTFSGKDANGAMLQTEEADIILRADATMIEETLWHYIEKPALEFLFPGQPPLAYLKLKTPDRTDAMTEIRITEHLVKHGVPVSRKSEAERFGRSMPEDGEELLTVPAAPTPPASAEEPLANAASADDPVTPQANYLEASRQMLGAAMREEIAPILRRLEQIAAMTDEAERREALEALRTSLPQILEGSDPDGPLTAAWEAIFGTQILNGLTTKK